MPTATPTEAGTDLPSEEEVRALATFLLNLGCPQNRAGEMARMLFHRARQLSGSSGRTQAQALAHLIGLMKQGWAAKERGF